MILSGKIRKKKVFFEKVPIHSHCSISFQIYREQFFDSTLHYHPEIELTYVSEGTGRVLIGDEWMTFSPGHLALIGKNIPHLYVSVPMNEESAEFRVVSFGSIFLETVLSIPEFQPIKKMFDSANPALIFRGNELKNEFENINENEPLLLLRVLELLSLMAEQKPRISGSNRPFSVRTIYPEDSRKIGEVIRYLQCNFTTPISLEDAAEIIRMEPETFRRFFKRHVFLTFTDYLLELRLTLACKLLRETNKTVSEIAELSGFRNISNFNRLFLSRRKMSPKMYRKL